VEEFVIEPFYVDVVGSLYWAKFQSIDVWNQIQWNDPEYHFHPKSHRLYPRSGGWRIGILRREISDWHHRAQIQRDHPVARGCHFGGLYQYLRLQHRRSLYCPGLCKWGREYWDYGQRSDRWSGSRGSVQSDRSDSQGHPG